MIDGGSSDGSVEILKEYEETIQYWESEPDRGIYHAWNKGLGHVTGDWVHFLGADDYFPDAEVLARVAGALVGSEDAVRIAYGKGVFISDHGDILETFGEPWERAGAQFRHKPSIPHPATFHRTSLFEDHGRFNESFRIAGDYEFLLRELKCGQALFLPDIVVKAVTYSGVSSDWGYSLQSVREQAVAKKLNGIFPYDPAWMMLAAKVLVKDCLLATVGITRTRRVVDAYRRLTGRPPIWTAML